METIPRNRRSVITSLRAEYTQCTVYTLGNYFQGAECEARYAWQSLYANYSAKLTRSEGKLTVHVHSNLWYELRKPGGTS